VRTQIVELDRIADLESQGLAWKEPRQTDPGAVHDLLCTPLTDRYHRAAGLQTDASGTGPTCHWPQVTVAGDCALRIDSDGLAHLDCADRRSQGVGGGWSLALHRDLSARPQHSTDNGYVEER
jgi:hypothetical protein